MQLAPLGIGVSCLFPGATRTGMLYAPEDKPDEEFHEDAASDFQKALWEAARDAYKRAMETCQSTKAWAARTEGPTE